MKERRASAYRAALPADVGRPALPGRLIPRARARPTQDPSPFPSREGSPRLFLPVVGLLRPGPSEEPEQTRHALHRRPSNPTTCLSEWWGQRTRLSVRPRRPLLKDPRPCEAPVPRASAAGIREAGVSTPSYPRFSKYFVPAGEPNSDPGVQSGPRAPRAQCAPHPGGGAAWLPSTGPERQPGGALRRSRLPLRPGSLPPPPLPSPPRPLPAVSPSPPVCLSSRAWRGPRTRRLRPWDR